MATPLSSKAVGSIVKIKESGVAQEFYVAKHGYPTAGNGRTLLVRRYIYGTRQWHSSNINAYATSAIDSWLNGTYFTLLPTDIRAQIAATTISYTPGNGNKTVSSLSRKVFLLSATELGCSGTYTNVEGLTLESAATLRVVTDGSTTYGKVQWTRSPYTYDKTQVCILYSAGELGEYSCTFTTPGVRPAFALPSTIPVDNSNNITMNEEPTTPDGITIPDTIHGGKNAAISWGASTDPEGSLAGYVLERSVDSAAFSQLYTGINLTYTDNITFGWQTVQYRVKAYDTDNAESAYVTSAKLTVSNNNDPVISGNDVDLGLKSAAFDVQYTITNPDPIEKVLTVTETLDGMQKPSFIVTSGVTNIFSITESEWIEMLNGSHTLTIAAADNFGGSAIRTLTFSKNETEIEFTLETPLPADAMVTKAIMNLMRYIPVGADFTIEVCNNAFDENPTWENVTNLAANNKKFFLTNDVKTAENWGFNIRVKVMRQSAVGDCYINGIGGNFE